MQRNHNIVYLVESDNNSEASVKLKRLVKLIKSKTYKQKQQNMENIMNKAKETD